MKHRQGILSRRRLVSAPSGTGWGHRQIVILCAVGVVLGSVSGLDAQSTSLAEGNRRAVQLEDFYSLKTVDGLGISPDGQWVSYTVSTPVEADNSDIVESFLVRADGGTPTRIEHQGQNVTAPGWTPDGGLIYSHGDALYEIRPDRPNTPPARQTSDPREGVLSSDGQWRARVVDVEVSARPPERLSAFEQRHEERFLGDNFDWYPFKRDGEEFPLRSPAELPSREVAIEPAQGGEPRILTGLGLEAGSLSWYPDGRGILFSANDEFRNGLAYGTSDLHMVSPEGQHTRLTDDDYSYSGASVSPDGRWMAYVRSFGSDMIIERKLDHGGPQDLYVRPLAGGEPVNLTADWDLDVGTPRWSPDSRYLYFTTQIGGATHLFRAPARGGAVEQVTTGERRLNSLQISRDFRRIAYLVGEFDRPADVWVADIDGRNERRLSDVHRDFLANIQIATTPSRAVRWNSYDGTEIEGFLLFPHGYDPQGGRYPLIILNHGGPHAASGYGFNFRTAIFTAHGYFVFLPNFRSSTGYGEAFKWATWGGWGTNDGEDVLSGVDYLVENFPIDRDRVGTTGHSYGGILTNWLITRYPDRFRAAVSGAGESNWTSNYAMADVARTKETEFFGRPWEPRAREIMVRQSAYLNSLGVQTPTLFVHGDEDYRVPLSGAIQLYTSLKKQGVPSRMLIYEGMAHGIRGHWNNVHRTMHELGWWETYLKPTRTSSDDSGR